MTAPPSRLQREEPSILDIDEERSAEGHQRVVLHMQSGDDVTIEAKVIVMPK